MIGAIIGDMVGSPYEFDWNNIKTTDFPLFSAQSHFTDDSVMTLAVADGLQRGWGDPERTRRTLIRSMQTLGLEYPNAGYGTRFSGWLTAADPQPYGSWGNGSAMRVSPVGWFFNTLEEVLAYARLSAEISHDHPEGIRWAQATAAAIFLARTGKSKPEIKAYIESAFDCRFLRTCDEIRPSYRHVESCQETVPEAMTAFFEGDSFESVLRLAVSLGGDCDTLTAIAGSIAGAYYPIPEPIRSEAEKRLDARLLQLLHQAEQFCSAVR